MAKNLELVLLVPRFHFNDQLPTGVRPDDVHWVYWGDGPQDPSRGVELAAQRLTGRSELGALRPFIDGLADGLAGQLATPTLVAAELSASSSITSDVPAAPLHATMHDLTAAADVFTQLSDADPGRRTAVFDALGAALVTAYRMASPSEQRFLRAAAVRYLSAEVLDARATPIGLRAADVELNAYLLAEMRAVHPEHAVTPGEFAEDWVARAALDPAISADAVTPGAPGAAAFRSGIEAVFGDDRETALARFAEWERPVRPVDGGDGGEQSPAPTESFIGVAPRADVTAWLVYAVGEVAADMGRDTTWPDGEPWDAQIPPASVWAWNPNDGVFPAASLAVAQQEPEVAPVAAPVAEPVRGAVPTELNVAALVEPPAAEPTPLAATAAVSTPAPSLTRTQRIARHRHLVAELPGVVNEPFEFQADGRVPLLLPLDPGVYGIATSPEWRVPELRYGAELLHARRRLGITEEAVAAAWRLCRSEYLPGDLEPEVMQGAVYAGAAHLDEMASELGMGSPIQSIWCEGRSSLAELEAPIQELTFRLMVLGFTAQDYSPVRPYLGGIKETSALIDAGQPPAAAVAPLLNLGVDTYHRYRGRYGIVGKPRVPMPDGTNVALPRELIRALGSHRDAPNFRQVLTANCLLVNDEVRAAFGGVAGATGAQREATETQLGQLLDLVEHGGFDVEQHRAVLTKLASVDAVAPTVTARPARRTPASGARSGGRSTKHKRR